MHIPGTTLELVTIERYKMTCEGCGQTIPPETLHLQVSTMIAGEWGGTTEVFTRICVACVRASADAVVAAGSAEEQDT